MVDLYGYVKEKLKSGNIEYAMEKCNSVCNSVIAKLVANGKLLAWEKYRSYNEGLTLIVARDTEENRRIKELDEAETYDMWCWYTGSGDYSQG